MTLLLSCISRKWQTMADVDITEREGTPNEIIKRAKKFLRNGSVSLRGSKGGPCSREFKEETVLFNLNNCLELASGELDLIILANIQAFTCDDCVGTKRSRSSRCTYQFQAMPICKEMFLHLYGISYSWLRRLEHYGIHPRTRGNTKKLPSNTLPQSVTENVHCFLTNHEEENAFALPGRIPWMSKYCLWAGQKRVFGVSTRQPVKLLENKPNVVVTKPMTDPCMTCQQNTTRLVRAANFPEHEKADWKKHSKSIWTAPRSKESFTSKLVQMQPPLSAK